MPLLILSGLPCSGKTAFSLVFKTAAEEAGWNVDLINEESLLIEKNTLNVAHEKRNRSTFLSAIERSTRQNVITIADSQNYIKGFRYQLYCISRAANTPHAVVYCTDGFEACKLRNDNCNSYSSELFKDLCGRFEEPNSDTKWDSPLFYVSDGDPLPIRELLDILKGKPKKDPSMATVPKIALQSININEANQITQAIIDEIESKQKDNNNVNINLSHGDLVVTIGRPLKLGELKTLRNQFMNLCLKNSVNTMEKNIEKPFVEYLNSFLNK